MDPKHPGYVPPDDRIWIACVPKKAGTPKPITAAAIERCRECDCRVWIANSSIEILMTKPKQVWIACIPCWGAYIKANPKKFKDREVHTTELQQKEVLKATGFTVEDAFRPYGLKIKTLDLKKGKA